MSYILVSEEKVQSGETVLINQYPGEEQSSSISSSEQQYETAYFIILNLAYQYEESRRDRTILEQGEKSYQDNIRQFVDIINEQSESITREDLEIVWDMARDYNDIDTYRLMQQVFIRYFC